MLSNKKLVAASLLAISPSLKAAGDSSGGKTQIGRNLLILDEIPVEGVHFCIPANRPTETYTFSPNVMSVAVPVFETTNIKMNFVVSDVLHDDRDRVLVLLYSTSLSPSPQILTPISKKKFEINLTGAEILGIHHIPAQTMLPQLDTRIGLGITGSSTKFGFGVNLNAQKISVLIGNGQNTIYVQAGLLNKADFDSGNYSNSLILSEVDTIKFVANQCPQQGLNECGRLENYTSYNPTQHDFAAAPKCN